jgi:3-oxoadipate enol-lactonase
VAAVSETSVSEHRINRRSFLICAGALAGGGVMASRAKVKDAGGQSSMSISAGQAASRGAALGFELIDIVSPWIEAPETILFHHGLGADMRIWAQWLPQLVDRYRIVRFDMRGHGSSRAAVDLKPTLDRLGDDVLAVADAAKIGRFHFVGESGGGTIGLHLARTHPDRLQTLTVCNSPYKGQALPNVEPLRAAMLAPGGMAKWSEKTMGIRFHEGEVAPQVWSWFEKIQASSSPEFFLANLEMLGKVDLSDELPEIRLPVLVLGSDGSSATPVTLLSELQSKLPNARLQIFPHAKHGVAISRGTDCGRALRNFLESAV